MQATPLSLMGNNECRTSAAVFQFLHGVSTRVRRLCFTHVYITIFPEEFPGFALYSSPCTYLHAKLSFSLVASQLFSRCLHLHGVALLSVSVDVSLVYLCIFLWMTRFVHVHHRWRLFFHALMSGPSRSAY